MATDNSVSGPLPLRGEGRGGGLMTERHRRAPDHPGSTVGGGRQRRAVALQEGAAPELEREERPEVEAQAAVGPAVAEALLQGGHVEDAAAAHRVREQG